VPFGVGLVIQPFRVRSAAMPAKHALILWIRPLALAAVRMAGYAMESAALKDCLAVKGFAARKGRLPAKGAVADQVTFVPTLVVHQRHLSATARAAPADDA